MIHGDALAAGREAFDRHEWEQAFEMLLAADTEHLLAPEDLECLAEAARWSRHFPEMIDVLERAEAAYERAGDRRGAARMALDLCREHYQRGDEAMATGWISRATRLLEGDESSREYGMLMWSTAVGMFDGGNVEAARDLAARVVELGRRLEDPDLEAMALLYQGHSLLIEGDVEGGLRLMDEATAIALSGRLELRTAGTIYCSTIFSCRNRGDWRRAAEWTDVSLRWCERQSVSGFPGLCRFHRAEVMRLQGALADAEREALDATEELLASAPRFAAWAFHEVGEIRRRRGDMKGAADAFRRASELGFDPQPGLALLRLDEGDPVAALHAIERAVADDSAFVRESRSLLLPPQVTIAVAAGKLEVARAALAKLEDLGKAFGTPAVAAAVACANGEVALAEGRVADAVAQLRRAWQAWTDVDAPYEAARARTLLARAYRQMGDHGAATLELQTARAIFERLGATRDAARVDAVLAAPAMGTRAEKTFMFTDIVDSTKLLELLGDTAWENLLDWHDRTLRACFESHDCNEVKQEGDGFFVAFPSAESALTCAVSIQRTLAAHRREHGFAPQVRIGVHAAEVTDRGGDYLGKGVHAAARVGAAATAGEILASRDTISAAGDTFRSRSERALELKGLAAPVDVVTVDWESPAGR